jgi:BASS family bile acid:Na+ symporter
VSWIPTLTLCAMMLALGMTLRIADFARAAAMPSAVAVGLLGQLVLQPLLAFGLARGLGLSTTHAIGLVLIAACPGGVVSNALVRLARGDVALSILLTGLSSLVSFASLPAAIALAMAHFGGDGPPVVLSFPELVATLFGTTALPVVLGMLVLRHRPAIAARLHRPLLDGATGVLLLMIAALFASLATSGELSLASLFHRVLPAVVALVGGTMAAGYGCGRALGYGGATARTLALEGSMQNVNMALVVAMTFLGEQRYGGPAVVYLPVSFAFAGAMIVLGRRSGTDVAPRPVLGR